MKSAFRLVSPVVSIAALLLFWQLMAPPVVAIANNGDFGKLLGRFGLGAPNAFQYANTKYVFSDQYRWESGFSSSELLLIVPMLAVNAVVSKDGGFDIRLMGLIHSCLFLLALWLFVPLLQGLSRRSRAALSAAALFMFCDFTYAGYFNTFYMDVPAYLFLILAAVLYLRLLRWRRRRDAILLAISAGMAIASKPQYAVLGVWFAVLFWTARKILWPELRMAAWLAPLVTLLTVLAVFRFCAPAGYSAKAEFNVVFAEILPHSKNVAGALGELGLDDSYRVWIGTHAYSAGSRLEEPTFYQPFLQRVGYARIARFYLRHPSDSYGALRRSLDEGARYLIPMGNFDFASGQPPLKENQSFCVWSNLKRRLYFHRAPRLLFSFLGLSVAVAALLMVNRGVLPTGAVSGGVVFIGMAMTGLVVGALGDIFDPTRHHLIFFAQFDMLLLALLWLTITTLTRWRPLGRRHRAVPLPRLVTVDERAAGAGSYDD
ncbi:MAG TPA: glycosyltransferase family 39 protein [Candidatus Acidoferrales bacterium]|jgi:hypothetical protein|nr:glycosyltransferase family 39 protein [Candidatus Acidoferrales bacterium]